MLETGNIYVNGTAARKLEYDVYEENPVLRTKKKHKSTAKLKVKLIGYTLVIFALFLTITVRYAVITKINYDINKESRVYTKLRNANTRMKVDIERSIDLHAVKETAETRLGMQMPEEYQIVYVKVPKSDFTKLSESGEMAGKESGIINDIKDKIGSILYLLG